MNRLKSLNPFCVRIAAINDGWHGGMKRLYIKENVTCAEKTSSPFIPPINLFDGHMVVDQSELCYETISTVHQYNTQFTVGGWYSKNSMYLDQCEGCEECFACSGLKKAKYCIFNKQYSREEYEALKSKIVDHMKKTGEWGQPVPAEFSYFGYNETVAQEFYPLTKEQAKKQGLKWHEDHGGKQFAYEGSKADVPKDIKETKDDITETILIC